MLTTILKLKSTTVKDTPSKSQAYTKSERLKLVSKRRRTGSRSENGISVIAESPERKTKFTGANPNVSIFDSSFKSTLLNRCFSGKFDKSQILS